MALKPTAQPCKHNFQYINTYVERGNCENGLTFVIFCTNCGQFKAQVYRDLEFNFQLMGKVK